MNKALAAIVSAVGFIAVSTGATYAQATRTWVSGVGDDANPCSRTAPCKTFAGAISKTAAGGEISVLDPGGFGAVTITKSISLVSDGNEGSILVAGTAGITINAGQNDIVSIYGLKFEGTSTGTAGINIIQAAKVYISHVYIRDFLAAGQGYGVAVQSVNFPTRVYLNQVEIVNNNIGLYVHGSGSGYNAAFVDSCVLEANTTNSVYVDTANSGVTLTGSKLAGSSAFVTNGALTSTGNNFIAGSVGPTSTSPLR